MTPQVTCADQEMAVQAVEDRGAPGGERAVQMTFTFVANTQRPPDEPKQVPREERERALEERRPGSGGL